MRRFKMTRHQAYLESIACQALVEARSDARQRVADALRAYRQARRLHVRDRARWFRGHVYRIGYPLKCQHRDDDIS